MLSREWQQEAGLAEGGAGWAVPESVGLRQDTGGEGITQAEPKYRAERTAASREIGSCGRISLAFF